MNEYAGIDLSLTSPGLAMWNGEKVYTKLLSSKPRATGPVVEKKGGKLARMETYQDKLWRFRCLTADIEMWVPNTATVYLEGPSYGSVGRATHDIDGNWWALFTRLYDRGNIVHVIAPSVLKQYATGSGNAAKDKVMAAVIKRYPDIDVINNDVADAVALLAIGMRMAGTPLEDDMPVTHLRALDKLAVPVP
jgi:crossover junction endodeoxyribonuclease RuvC